MENIMNKETVEFKSDKLFYEKEKNRPETKHNKRS